MDSDLLECEELILSSPNGPTDPISDFLFWIKIPQILDFLGIYFFSSVNSSNFLFLLISKFLVSQFSLKKNP